jgi:hypothetical protein
MIDFDAIRADIERLKKLQDEIDQNRVELRAIIAKLKVLLPKWTRAVEHVQLWTVYLESVEVQDVKHNR